MTTADVLDSGVCQSCLADAAKAIDSDDDLEFNFAQESEETLASTDVNHVCPVCSTKSIPVNAEHYALFVKKPSIHGVVTMKMLPVQALQISFTIIVFQINTNKEIELKVPSQGKNVSQMVR